MSDLSGVKLVGRPFAVWPATMQMMPAGVLEGAFGRFFVGVKIANGGTGAWPTTNARLSARCRQTLLTEGFLIDDSWAAGDASAFDQQLTAEWVVIPALAPNQNRLIFFKLDARSAHPGVHDFEIELRDPAAPSQPTVRARAPLCLAQTTFDSHTQSFVTRTDKATVTTTLTTAAFDVETLRRALARARALFAPNPLLASSPAAQLERVRTQLNDFLCGGNQDICQILGDLNSFCAVPQVTPPPPVTSPAGLDGYAIFGDQAATLADRDKVPAGAVGSNQTVTIGNDAVMSGSVISGADTIIGDRTTISGSVTAAGFFRRGANDNVGGAVREHATYFPITIPTRSVQPGTTAVSLANGATKKVDPGAYGALLANANSILQLSSGLYQFTSFNLQPDVTLQLTVTSGPIEIRTSQLMAFGDRTVFQVTGDANGSAIQFYSAETDELRIGTDIAAFTGLVTAPAGTIHVNSRTNVRGGLWAKTVKLEPDISVSRVGSTGWLGQGASGLEMLAYPTALDATVEYSDGFFGKTGPQAFDAVPWKSLLAHVGLFLNLGIGSALAAALGSTAGDAVIGRLKNALINAPGTAPGTPPPATQAGSVDAAVVSLLGNRALGSPIFSLLDAQTGEPNGPAVAAPNGKIALPGTFLKNTDISTLLANAASDPGGLKVYKSGAATGITYGVLAGLIPVFKRTDPSGTLNFINQLSITPDTSAQPPGGTLAAPGDSGAVWIHARTSKIIALDHTVGPSGAIASRIEDVVNALAIQFA